MRLRNPATIEISGLWNHAVAAHPAFIHSRSVKSQAVSNVHELRRWLWIAPGCSLGSHAVDIERPLFGNAFEFARGQPRSRSKNSVRTSPERQIIDGRVARLQNAQYVIAIRDRLAGEDNSYMVLDLFKTRRPRIIPYSLLTRVRYDWFWSPVHLTGPKLKSSTDKGEDDYAPIIQ